MNEKRFRLIDHAAPAVLVFMMLLALVAPGLPAVAQDETPTAEATETLQPTETPPTANLTISAVQPGNVVNDLDVEIVVTGTGFARGATVVLARFGGLATQFVSDNVLRATVPAGVPGGRYTVRVVNPNATTAELPDALNVTAVAGGTATPVETATPEPTAFIRPLLVVQSYGASSPTITPNQNLDFEMTLANAGQATASNVLVTFTSGDFVPRETGGVRALGTMPPGQPVRFWQPLFATADLRGKTTAVLKVTATYTDITGQSYENAFELTFPVTPSGGGGAGPSPTPTATATITPTVTPRPRPQLLVTSSATDPEQLQPGGRFTLTLDVENRGQADARNITMILGGGSAGDSGGDGTPTAGGVSGGSGSFGEFAPVGSSNVSALGNLAVGEITQATQQLIVNTTTKAGAYPVKVSFVYTDNTGANYVDDQVVTLLVFETPQVELGFYAPPPVLFAGEPGSLPLQVVNTGRNSAIFGNFSATAENADLSNNTIFVGALEPGGFFPLDAQITAFEPGTLDVLLSLNYVDDFNQPAVITDTVQVEVMEAIPLDPLDPGLEGGGEGIDGGVPPDDGQEGGQESLGQRIWRFLLGLLGLSSAPATDTPTEELPPPIDGEFVVP